MRQGTRRAATCGGVFWRARPLWIPELNAGTCTDCNPKWPRVRRVFARDPPLAQRRQSPFRPELGAACDAGKASAEHLGANPGGYAFGDARIAEVMMPAARAEAEELETESAPRRPFA